MTYYLIMPSDNDYEDDDDLIESFLPIPGVPTETRSSLSSQSTEERKNRRAQSLSPKPGDSVISTIRNVKKRRTMLQREKKGGSVRKVGSPVSTDSVAKSKTLVPVLAVASTHATYPIKTLPTSTTASMPSHIPEKRSPEPRDFVFGETMERENLIKVGTHVKSATSRSMKDEIFESKKVGEGRRIRSINTNHGVPIIPVDGWDTFLSVGKVHKTAAVNKIMKWILSDKNMSKREPINFTEGDARYQYLLDSVATVAGVTVDEIADLKMKLNYDLIAAFGEKWKILLDKGELKLSSVQFLVGGSTYQRWHCDRPELKQSGRENATKPHPCVLLYALGGDGDEIGLSLMDANGREMVAKVGIGGIIYIHGNKFHRGIIYRPHDIRLHVHFDTAGFENDKYKDTFIMNASSIIDTEANIFFEGIILVCSKSCSGSLMFLQNYYRGRRKFCHVLELIDDNGAMIKK